MSEWQYVLLQIDENGEIVEGIDVTDEVVCLYKRIEFLEASNEGFKKLVLDGLKPTVH